MSDNTFSLLNQITNHMSLQEKQSRLAIELRAYGRVAVAFSAGVDSAVVCRAAIEACGSNCLAITAVSPSMASGELEEASHLASTIGIRHFVIRTNEFDNPDYTSNPTNRCRFCKTELYSQIHARREELGFDTIVNGANIDDLGDYRPGMQAATEWNVRSPLIESGMSKSDVRALAKFWGLSVWDKPATPCLSSRIAYGIEVTPERLRRIDNAESFLKRLLNQRELRVRCEANEHARVEVPMDSVARATEQQETIRGKLVELGFATVAIDPRGFRSGSLNESLPLVTIDLSSTSANTSSGQSPESRRRQT